MALLIALLVLLATIVYTFVVKPLFLSPLSRIPPAHWSCHISSFWIYHARWTKREIRSIHDAHRKLGPAVRLAPNEVSINYVKGGLSKVYGGGWEKGEWYSFFANYGIAPMFATPSSKLHSQRKRMLSNIYSKSTIQSSASLRAATAEIVHRRLLPLLESLMTTEGAEGRKSSAPYDIYSLFRGLTMDVVTAYIFGLGAGSDLTTDAPARDRFVRLHNCRQPFSFWPQEFPALTARLRRWLGVRVASRAWSLHRNEDVFPEAERWVPERWLGKGDDGLLGADGDDDERQRYKEMMCWFWAFGSGGRMCVGSHLAMYQMKFIVGAIWSNYVTKVVSDEGMEQIDAYTAPPESSQPLMVKFECIG